MSFYSTDQNGMGEIVVRAAERTGKDEGGYIIQEPVKEANFSPYGGRRICYPNH